MRLFYRLTGTSKWSEADHLKLRIQGDDCIVCHTADLRDRFLGEAIIMGHSWEAILPDSLKLTVKADPGAIIFFTKIPKDTDYTCVTDFVHTEITFPEDWFDDI